MSTTIDQILDSPTGEAKRFHYAGFWIRTAAYLIDGIVLQIISVALSYIIYGRHSFIAPELPITLSGLVIGILYFVVLESSAKQATLGKMAVGIKVGDENGGQISFMNALGRYLAKFISAILLCIGFMMAGWDKNKQAMHDKIAGTYVFYAVG